MELTRKKSELKTPEDANAAASGSSADAGSNNQQANGETSPGKEASVSPKRRTSLSPTNRNRDKDESPSKSAVASATTGSPTRQPATGADAVAASAPPQLMLPEPDAFASSGLGSSSPDAKAVQAGRTASTVLARGQPYRYGDLKPPHLSIEDLKRKDNVEEEYPLTYDELKVKVWHGEHSVQHAD
ncbi:hypothetical protein PINS_up018205 [Pythium insidiosum]|nr:hypothetical protein PINS_up018205 [Pythium insidiosum]